MSTQSAISGVSRVEEARERSMRRLTNLVQQTAANSWYRITNEAGAPTRVDIYDEIGGGGWFSTGVTAVDFVAELAGIVGDLEVHINSPGGDVFDGLAIYNSLAQRPGNVTTVVDGLAASAASFIAQAGKQRVVSPGSMMMIHDAAGVAFGNGSDMREMADLLDKVSDNLASIYASHSGIAEGWRDAMQKESWYTADEAVAAGLADRLAERPASDALAAAAKFDLSAYEHAPTLVDADQRPVAKAQPALGDESMPVLSAKALPIHHTATVDEPWDGPAAVAAMPADDEVLEYCFAWQSAAAAATPHKEGDDDADDRKGNYKFPHHKTKGGPANLDACRNGLARLDGADIPDGDQAGVKSHLQAHLDDAADKGDDADQAHDHAGLPGWLQNDAAPLPAWLQPAKEAK